MCENCKRSRRNLKHQRAPSLQGVLKSWVLLARKGRASAGHRDRLYLQRFLWSSLLEMGRKRATTEPISVGSTSRRGMISAFNLKFHFQSRSDHLLRGTNLSGSLRNIFNLGNVYFIKKEIRGDPERAGGTHRIFISEPLLEHTSSETGISQFCFWPMCVPYPSARFQCAKEWEYNYFLLLHGVLSVFFFSNFQVK